MKNENLNQAIELYKNSKLGIAKVCDFYGISKKTLVDELNSLGISIDTENTSVRIDSVLKNVTEYNLEQIHKDYGISIEILNKALVLSNKDLKDLQIKLAVKEYIETNKFERSIAKISIKYGINKKTLVKQLKDKNIEITKCARGYKVNENIFNKIDTEEKAYWLGFMYADGYVYTNSNGIGLTLSLKDKEHLEKFNKFLGYEGGMNISVSHQFGTKDVHNVNGEVIQVIRTVIHNDTLWKDLVDKGCAPNKSLILKFPDKSIFSDESLIFAFIRGYFDGDGSLGKYQHSKTNTNKEESLMFVGTLPFLLGVLEYLGKGFIMHKTNCSDKTFRLSYSTSKARHAAELMYNNATVYLNRKYNIYINDFAAVKSGKNGEG